MVDVERARKAVLGIEIDRDQVAVRIAAKCIGLVPPDDFDATQALNQMNSHPGASGDGMGEGFRRAAEAAIIYIFERIANGSRVQ